MIRTALALVVVVLSATPALAKLEIVNIQPRHGYLGPERKSLDFYPYDEVFFRFQLTGVKLDKDELVQAEMTVQLLDAKGKDVLPNPGEKYALGGATDLGGDSTFGFATVRLDERTPPGDYTLTVTVKDRVSGEQASFRRKLTYKKPEFALITPRFFHDPTGSVPAPMGGLLGERLFYGFVVIGFEGMPDQAKVEVKLEVLDAKGKAVLSRVIRSLPLDKETEPAKRPKLLGYWGELALFRTGDFTLRITAMDKATKKTATFEAPLHVAAP
jgi:hypothetical protein